MELRYAEVVSTGMYIPELEVTNDALRERFRTIAPDFVDKIEARSGIRTRFHAPDDWATSDLAVRAARHALERAGLTALDVDLIVLGTDSPDYVTPATSVVVQEKLGAKRAGTFDVGCACASFPTAVATAAGLIATNAALRHVLVIGAYMMHKLADPNDTMSFFYGDGAGAAVLRPSAAPGVLTSAFRADGGYAKHWYIASGGTAEPASHAAIDAGRTQVRMVIKYPNEINDEGWPAVVRTLMERGQFGVDDIDCAIFTQVRKAQIERACADLGLSIEKAPMIMQKWGYTGSACIPMALHDAVVTKRAKPGDLVVLVGSGVGFNQAGVALKLTDDLSV